MIESVTVIEACLHFLTIGWKVLFALVPPAKYRNGWLAFFVTVTLIGFVTAILGEAANLLGCALGLKQSVVGITFVSIGLSIPDIFTSIFAAQNSDSADDALTNVAGSSTVSVLIGLGVPWLIGAFHAKGNSENGLFKVA